ncbi:stage III sporulation protein AA [Collibacillus ludicampi]|jgi:stage III sporulation protein AA|uniref:Stage III sporulation protein AA n=1 Tax=Collibacillus ludicampi TaxID=2771369 RepID=A0AAV4L9R2_9BACL|nr:stage III sporulation protein AA [Collibacillus ludicampi]GIM44564.1 stage III sporulation protein AA [Collibacillus ludicampi]
MPDRRLEEQIYPLLSPRLREVVTRAPTRVLSSLEEIRLRQGKALQIYYASQDAYLDERGGLQKDAARSVIVHEEDIRQTLHLVTRSSLYALEEELRRGYITVTGGHRIGITGRAVLSKEGQVRTLKEIAAFNIRIAREIIGAANRLKEFVIDPTTSRVFNTLLISPPQCGKTTLLRDLARQISNGTLHANMKGMKVGIVDERSELAGCVHGVPQHDVGSRTDVLDACPKAEGMLMMIRSMSPQLLITDEIGRMEDCEAILEAVHAGVHVITTAHGFGLQEVRKRPAIRELFQAGAFSRYIVLSRRSGPGTIEAVYDGQGGRIHVREAVPS